MELMSNVSVSKKSAFALIFANRLPKKRQNLSSSSAKRQKYLRGFTLIELLVVISIIAMLVAASSSSWRNAQEKGRDGKRKTDLKAIQQALENYYQTNGKYPGGTNTIRCNVGSDTTSITWGAVFSCDGDGSGGAAPIVYMQQLPKDPVNSGAYVYNYSPGAGVTPTTYQMYARLENVNDKELNPVDCGQAASVPIFCVKNP